MYIHKYEYIPKKIKLSAQINHFIHPDFSTCKGSGLYRNKFYSPNYNLLKSPQQYILQHMMLIPVTCSKPLPSYVSRIHHSISKHNFFRYRPKVYISQYRLGLVFDGFSSFCITLIYPSIDTFIGSLNPWKWKNPGYIIALFKNYLVLLWKEIEHF